MPDSGDDRDARCENGTCQRLLIVGPHVLDAATAATNHNGVRSRQAELRGGIQHLNGANGFTLHSLPLNPHWKHHHADPWRTAGQDVEHVLDCCARGRSDKSDNPRKFGNRLLVVLIKKPLFKELLFQRLKTCLKTPLPFHLHLLDHHLVLAALLIDRDVPKNLNLRAVSQSHATARGRTAKHDTGQLRAGILQGEVLVSAGLQPVIADFPLHPHRADVPLQHLTNFTRELGDG